METYGHDFARLQAGVRRVPAEPAVLRRRGAVRRRRATCARSCRSSPSRCITYGFARRRAGARRERRARRRAHALPRACAKAAPARSTCALNLPGRHNVLNALAAIAVGTEVGVAGRGDRARRSPSSTASGGASSATARSRCAGGGSFTLDRRLRPSPGGDGGDARGRARRVPGPAHRARVPAAPLHAHARPASRISCACCRRVDALLLAEVYPAGEAPIVAADGRALARAVRVAGKVEPVFVEEVADDAGGDPATSRATATWCVTMGAGSIGGVPAQLREARRMQR